VFDEAAVDAIDRAAAAAGRPAAVFVKVDTGLRRLGVWHEAAPEFIAGAARRAHLTIAGIYSSLQQVPEQDRLALARFRSVDAAVTSRGISRGVRSLASSDAIFHFPDAHLDLVRPGMSLYGIYPEDKDREAGLALRPVLSLKARIEQVKWVNAGDSVTYWGRFVAPSRMELATVHVGFHQVLPRELANKGVVMFAGAPRAMVGSISLNHAIVDVTGAGAKVGDVVEVIGPDGPTSASEIAKTAGWMVYSLLNHLSLSTPRVYVEGGQVRTVLA
jgi:alanine racemase